MEGHRYANGPDPSWYPRRDPYGEQPPGAPFRLPGEPVPPPEADRYPAADPYAATDPLSSTGTRLRLPAEPPPHPAPEPAATPRGPGYPAILPGGGAPAGEPAAGGGAPDDAAAGPAYEEPTTAVPSVGRRAGTGARPVYRARPPARVALLAAVTVVLMVPVLRLLVQATVAGPAAGREVVPAVLLALGVPLTAAGLVALAGGRASAPADWLRPPLAYLSAGLVLLLAAAVSVT
jgi:hypothetical protein